MSPRVRRRPSRPSFFAFSFYKCERCDEFLYAPLTQADATEYERQWWCLDCNLYYREPPDTDVSEWQREQMEADMEEMRA